MSRLNKRITIIVLVIAAISILLFRSMSEEAGGVQNVYAKAAQDLMAKNPDLQIIDVREPVEYEVGHISKSRLIPLGQLPQRFNELDREKPVLLVCRSGNRSSHAAKLLVEKGFSRVYNLTGGILEWPYGLET